MITSFQLLSRFRVKDVMGAGEIIGISVVAVVAVVIIVIYLCKCYSDFSLGYHEQNIKPINLDNDQDLALISVECANPMPHDPYFADAELARKDHNDLEMVSMSIEQFIRKESYRKSQRGNQRNYKKLGQKAHSSSSTGIEEDPGNVEHHGISSHTDEIDGGLPQSVKGPIANGNGYHHSNKAIDAPVIVHHSLGHQQSLENQPPSKTELYSHIYAAVEKSKPAPSAPSMDPPTYFRPVKATPATISSNMPQSSAATTIDQSSVNDSRPVIPPMSAKNHHSTPTLSENQEQEFKSDVTIPVSVKKPRKHAQKSLENVPPNEQELTQENLFFIPEEVVSPKTPKKSRRANEGNIKTLDDLGVTAEKPKTPKKSKKAKGKGDGAPKAQKRRKKSVPDLDIAKPIMITDIEPEVLSPKSPRPEVTNSIGLKSPPIPPKPKFNPLLSPVTTRNMGNARVSQL